ncbi:hypothetical protein [Maritalea porphyrae]|uniref:hypothetical protein n=1 Tax=Maritalea porphyrae TaxID=880732 RepID=UPI0022AED28D|nr:hypothetical protein [Maritalea porphyrae]MCZ4270943.1 hypothetical protein [Maritalea porphyrae]
MNRMRAPYAALNKGNINQTVNALAKTNNKQKKIAVMDALWLCLHADDGELDQIEDFLKSKGYRND